MSYSKTIVLTVMLLIVFAANASAASPSESITLFQESSTFSQSAVFAAFLSRDLSSGGNAAISVSNVLAVPPGPTFTELRIDGKNDTTGGVTVYLFDQNGANYVFRTEDNPDLGEGVDDNGQLGPGGTLTILLSEIVDAVTDEPSNFSGYAWVVADFDAVGGTATNFFPGISSGNSFVLFPQGEGIPVEVP